ncbi:hypothetical protein F2Q68_00000825, partial [Brassica cretica]
LCIDLLRKRRRRRRRLKSLMGVFLPSEVLLQRSETKWREAIGGRKTDASFPTSSSSNGGRMSFSEPKTEPSRETNGDLKRKQSEEQNHPSKFPRSSDKPSPSNKKEGDGFKKPKSLKEVWSVLKPPKQPQTNKGSN